MEEPIYGDEQEQQDWFIRDGEDDEEEDEYYFQENMEGIRELFSPNRGKDKSKLGPIPAPAPGVQAYNDLDLIAEEKVPPVAGRPQPSSSQADPYRQQAYSPPAPSKGQANSYSQGEGAKGYLYNIKDYATSYGDSMQLPNRDPTLNYLVAEDEDPIHKANRVTGGDYPDNKGNFQQHANANMVKGETGNLNNKGYVAQGSYYQQPATSSKGYPAEGPYYNSNSYKGYTAGDPGNPSTGNKGYTAAGSGYPSNSNNVYSVGNPGKPSTNNKGYAVGSPGYSSTSSKGYTAVGPGYQSTSNKGKHSPAQAVPGPSSYNSQNYWSSTKGIPGSFGDPDFMEYEIDFYGEKNYEYIDTDESEDLKKIFEVNRKLSESYSNDLEKMELEFDPVDYQNYDFAEVGVLDFR